MKTWTDEEIEKIKELRADGWTIRALGIEFGVTKGVMGGILERRHISSGVEHIKSVRIPRSGVRRTRIKYNQRDLAPWLSRLAMPKERAVADDMKLIPLRRLGTIHCRFPASYDTLGRHLFCGRKRRDMATAYCDEHHYVCYIKGSST